MNIKTTHQQKEKLLRLCPNRTRSFLAVVNEKGKTTLPAHSQFPLLHLTWTRRQRMSNLLTSNTWRHFSSATTLTSFTPWLFPKTRSFISLSTSSTSNPHQNPFYFFIFFLFQWFALHLSLADSLSYLSLSLTLCVCIYILVLQSSWMTILRFHTSSSLNPPSTCGFSTRRLFGLMYVFKLCA